MYIGEAYFFGKSTLDHFVDRQFINLVWGQLLNRV